MNIDPKSSPVGENLSQLKKINKNISINFTDNAFVRDKLKELIEHNPIDAFFAGVKLDKNKVPNSADLDKAAELHTVIILT